MQLFVKTTRTHVLEVCSDATGRSLSQAVQVRHSAGLVLHVWSPLCACRQGFDVVYHCRQRQACLRAPSGSHARAVPSKTTKRSGQLVSDPKAPYRSSIDSLVAREVLEPCFEEQAGPLSQTTLMLAATSTADA